MKAVEKFSTQLGTAVACRAFGVPRASLYRRRQREATPGACRTRAGSHRALSATERQEVLDVLHSEPLVDQAPTQVVAALMDEERYLCSVRTMYRILDIFSRKVVGWIVADFESSSLAGK